MTWHCQFRHPVGILVGVLGTGSCPAEACQHAVARFLREFREEPVLVPADTHPHLDRGRRVGATRNRPAGVSFELVLHRGLVAEVTYRVVVREIGGGAA